MERSSTIVRVSADLADLVPRYLENRRADLLFLQDLLALGDLPPIAGVAHRIRGNAASYGFVPLGEIVGALEDAASHGDVSAVTDALQAYEHFLRTVEIDYV